MKRILIIDGHPDPAQQRFMHAWADAYAQGATEVGHQVRTIHVARLEFPLLRTSEDFERGEPVPCIRAAQDDIVWCDHLVILYPLWLGSLPALLKGFLEQSLRPRFAFGGGEGRWPKKLLIGKSAHVIVTMGMPAFVYRWYFGAHSLKSLKKNILNFCGVRPVVTTLIGSIASHSERKRKALLAKAKSMGRAGC